MTFSAKWLVDKIAYLKHTDAMQLLFFFWIQVISVLVIMAGLHYMQTRELQILEYKLQSQNISLRSNVVAQFDMVDNFADDLRQKFTYATPWLDLEADAGNKLVRDSIVRSIPQVKVIRIFNENGLRVLTSDAPVPPVIDVSDKEYFQDMKNKGLDKAHFGPYLSKTTHTLSYAIVRKLISPKTGNFAGALLVGIDTAYFGELCKNVVPSETYESYVLNSVGEVILWCSFGKVHHEAFGKVFKNTSIGSNFDQHEILTTDKSTYESDSHSLFVNRIPGYSGLIVVTAATKELAYSSITGLMWQNYMLLMVAAISQLVCFMLYHNALKSIKMCWVSNTDIPNVTTLLEVHLEWKKIFGKAIKEKLPMDVEQAGNSHICKTGRWIITNVGQYKFLKSYNDLVQAHTQFHEEAKRIAIFVNRGVYASAEQALEEGSAYNKAAIAVEVTLQQLIKDINQIENRTF